MKPLINKVTFKSWCHPLLAVSALCLLSGAPDPPQRWWEPWRSACTICTESHSLTWYGIYALPTCISVMPADWWLLVLSLNPAWLAPEDPWVLLTFFYCLLPKELPPRAGQWSPALLSPLCASPYPADRRCYLDSSPKWTHDRGTGRPPGRVCWQVWVQGGVGFCF